MLRADAQSLGRELLSGYEMRQIQLLVNALARTRDFLKSWKIVNSTTVKATPGMVATCLVNRFTEEIPNKTRVMSPSPRESIRLRRFKGTRTARARFFEPKHQHSEALHHETPY